jgi:heat shock protein HslJ
MPISASLRWLAPCLLAVGLAACSSPPRRAADGQDPRFQPASASDILAQTSWDLARWTKPGGALRPVPHPSTHSRPLTVSFIHDQGAPRIAGFAGCNQYSASYTVANGLLIVRDHPVSTMMACAPDSMALEQDFLAGMTRITASSVDSTNNPQRMTWILASGDTLDFGRRTDPIAGGQPGPTKLVYVNSERVPCSAGAGRALCY